eukprot:gnl/MRDRNA2_/MRDRNA2_26471_c0_seq1.p1 gnl/MRDRNA2_/MRDRNA2_26471_c0~~gnl/MRDRNA2_/MRDRNA2_26471_c0_seq1.p1  ORF type:complete len:261 (+),score=44.81 gnl/MRDRNA2_/MRDRNA2_26471_c0_seq1:162-944(+)
MRGALFLALGPTLMWSLLIPPGRFFSNSDDAPNPLGHVSTANVASSPQGALQSTLQITVTNNGDNYSVMISLALLVVLVMVILVAAVFWSTRKSEDSYKPFIDDEREVEKVGSAVERDEVKIAQGDQENLTEELAQRALFAQEIAKMNISNQMWEAMKGLSSSPFSPISSSSSEASIFEDISRNVSFDKLPFGLLMGEDPRPKSPVPVPQDVPSDRAPPDFKDIVEEPVHSVGKKLLHPLEKRARPPKKSKSKARGSAEP